MLSTQASEIRPVTTTLQSSSMEAGRQPRAVQDGPAHPHHRSAVRHAVHRQLRLPQDGPDRRVRQRAGAELSDEGRHAGRGRHPHPPLLVRSGGAVRLRPDPAAVQETDRPGPGSPGTGKHDVRRHEPRTGARAGHDRHAGRAVRRGPRGAFPGHAGRPLRPHGLLGQAVQPAHDAARDRQLSGPHAGDRQPHAVGLQRNRPHQRGPAHHRHQGSGSAENPAPPATVAHPRQTTGGQNQERPRRTGSTRGHAVTTKDRERPHHAPLAFRATFYNNECKYESFLFKGEMTMPTALPMTAPATQPVMSARPTAAAVSPTKRISSAGLMDGGRELEIEHAGRVYRLRQSDFPRPFTRRPPPGADAFGSAAPDVALQCRPRRGRRLRQAGLGDRTPPESAGRPARPGARAQRHLPAVAGTMGGGGGTQSAAAGQDQFPQPHHGARPQHACHGLTRSPYSCARNTIPWRPSLPPPCPRWRACRLPRQRRRADLAPPSPVGTGPRLPLPAGGRRFPAGRAAQAGRQGHQRQGAGRRLRSARGRGDRMRHPQPPVRGAAKGTRTPLRWRALALSWRQDHRPGGRAVARGSGRRRRGRRLLGRPYPPPLHPRGGRADVPRPAHGAAPGRRLRARRHHQIQRHAGRERAPGARPAQGPAARRQPAGRQERRWRKTRGPADAAARAAGGQGQPGRFAAHGTGTAARVDSRPGNTRQAGRAPAADGRARTRDAPADCRPQAGTGARGGRPGAAADPGRNPASGRTRDENAAAPERARRAVRGRAQRQRRHLPRTDRARGRAVLAPRRRPGRQCQPPRRQPGGGRPGDLPDRLHQPQRLLAREGLLQAQRQALRVHRQPQHLEPGARAGTGRRRLIPRPTDHKKTPPARAGGRIGVTRIEADLVARRRAQRQRWIAVGQVFHAGAQADRLGDGPLALPVEGQVRRYFDAEGFVHTLVEVIRSGRRIGVAIAVVGDQRVRERTGIERGRPAHDMAERHRVVGAEEVHAVDPDVVGAGQRVVGLHQVGAVQGAGDVAEAEAVTDGGFPVDTLVVGLADVDRQVLARPVGLAVTWIHERGEQVAVLGGVAEHQRFRHGFHGIADAHVPQVGLHRERRGRLVAEADGVLLRLLRLQVFVAARYLVVLGDAGTAIRRVFRRQRGRAGPRTCSVAVGRDGLADVQHRRRLETGAVRTAHQERLGRLPARRHLVGVGRFLVAHVAVGDVVLDRFDGVVTAGGGHFDGLGDRGGQFEERAVVVAFHVVLGRGAEAVDVGRRGVRALLVVVVAVVATHCDVQCACWQLEQFTRGARIDALERGRRFADRTVEHRVGNLGLGRCRLRAGGQERVERVVGQHVAERRVLHVAAFVALVDRVLRPGQAGAEVPGADVAFRAQHEVFRLGDGIAVAVTPVERAVAGRRRGHVGDLVRRQVRRNVRVVQRRALGDGDRRGVGRDAGGQVQARVGGFGKHFDAVGRAVGGLAEEAVAFALWDDLDGRTGIETAVGHGGGVVVRRLVQRTAVAVTVQVGIEADGAGNRFARCIDAVVVVDCHVGWRRRGARAVMHVTVAVPAERNERAAREIAVGRFQARLVVVTCRQHDVVAVFFQVAKAEGGADIVAAAGAALARLAPVAFDGAALQIFLQNEVDDASDGVRAVQGRSAVGQDLDAFNRAHRNGVQVDRGARALRRDAAAVQQHQRVFLADAMDRRRHAATGVRTGCGRGNGETLHRWQCLHQLGYRGGASFGDLFGGQALDRQRAFHVDALDRGAGDFHFLDGLLLCGCLACEQCGTGQDCECHAHGLHASFLL
uniref:Uncharacterized protein n=1 Tax=Tanacetum cinerariifolium TaxID=118510 RepID=A0A699GFP0_TANCI|nr:hypothetical protein [Tanacetum cinerariifolium]